MAPGTASPLGSSVVSSGVTNKNCSGPTSFDDTRIAAELQEEIDSKFQPKKESSLILASLYNELGLDGRSIRVSDCGTFLEFYKSSEGAKLQHANFCRDRLCPMCNWRRSMKIFAQNSQIMNVLQHQGYQFIFLTLTVRNCSGEDLPRTVGAIFDGWRFLYNKCSKFRKICAGSFRSLEVTRNLDIGTYHPHLHVILAVRPDYFSGRNYISTAEWSKIWRSCCDLSYDPIVDVRKIKADVRGIAGAVAEVSKYAAKDKDYLTGTFEEMMSSVVAFLESLSGRRLVGRTGCFKQVAQQLKLDDVENGDLVHVEGEQLRSDLAYAVVRYFWRCGVYVTG